MATTGCPRHPRLKTIPPPTHTGGDGRPTGRPPENTLTTMEEQFPDPATYPELLKGSSSESDADCNRDNGEPRVAASSDSKTSGAIANPEPMELGQAEYPQGDHDHPEGKGMRAPTDGGGSCSSKGETAATSPRGANALTPSAHNQPGHSQFTMREMFGDYLPDDVLNEVAQLAGMFLDGCHYPAYGNVMRRVCFDHPHSVSCAYCIHGYTQVPIPIWSMTRTEWSVFFQMTQLLHEDLGVLCPVEPTDVSEWEESWKEHVIQRLCTKAHDLGVNVGELLMLYRINPTIIQTYKQLDHYCQDMPAIIQELEELDIGVVYDRAVAASLMVIAQDTLPCAHLEDRSIGDGRCVLSSLAAIHGMADSAFQAFATTSVAVNQRQIRLRTFKNHFQAARGFPMRHLQSLMSCFPMVYTCHIFTKHFPNVEMVRYTIVDYRGENVTLADLPVQYAFLIIFHFCRDDGGKPRQCHAFAGWSDGWTRQIHIDSCVSQGSQLSDLCASSQSSARTSAQSHHGNPSIQPSVVDGRYPALDRLLATGNGMGLAGLRVLARSTGLNQLPRLVREVVRSPPPPPSSSSATEEVSEPDEPPPQQPELIDLGLTHLTVGTARLQIDTWRFADKVLRVVQIPDQKVEHKFHPVPLDVYVDYALWSYRKPYNDVYKTSCAAKLNRSWKEWHLFDETKNMFDHCLSTLHLCAFVDEQLKMRETGFDHHTNQHVLAMVPGGTRLELYNKLTSQFVVPVPPLPPAPDTTFWGKVKYVFNRSHSHTLWLNLKDIVLLELQTRSTTSFKSMAHLALVAWASAVLVEILWKYLPLSVSIVFLVTSVCLIASTMLAFAAKAAVWYKNNRSPESQRILLVHPHRCVVCSEIPCECGETIAGLPQCQCTKKGVNSSCGVCYKADRMCECGLPKWSTLEKTCRLCIAGLRGTLHSFVAMNHGAASHCNLVASAPRFVTLSVDPYCEFKRLKPGAEIKNGDTSGSQQRVSWRGLFVVAWVFLQCMPLRTNPTYGAMYLALRNRACADTPPPSKMQWKRVMQFWKENKSRILGKKNGKIPKVHPTPFDVWNCRFPARRQKEHTAAWHGYLHGRWHLDKTKLLNKAHVKIEKLLKVTPDGPEDFAPRCIQAFTSEANVLLGPFAHAVSAYVKKRLASGSLLFGAGMNAEVMGAAFASIPDDYVCMEDDFSLYDSTEGEEAFKLFFQIMDDFGIRRYSDVRKVLHAQLKTYGTTRQGLRYSVPATMKSGSSTTSLQNSLLNLITHLFVVCEITGKTCAEVLEHVKIIVNGDDNVLAYPQSWKGLTPTRIKQEFEVLGLVAKPVRKTKRTVVFCASRPWPVKGGGCVMGPDFARHAGKIGLSLLDPGDADAWMGGVLKGYKNVSLHVPFWRALWLSLTAKYPTGSERLPQHRHQLAEKSYETCQATWDMVSEVYGLTAADEAELFALFESLPRTALVSHPALAVLFQTQ